MGLIDTIHSTTSASKRLHTVPGPISFVLTWNACGADISIGVLFSNRARNLAN